MPFFIMSRRDYHTAHTGCKQWLSRCRFPEEQSMQSNYGYKLHQAKHMGRWFKVSEILHSGVYTSGARPMSFLKSDGVRANLQRPSGSPKRMPGRKPLAKNFWLLSTGHAECRGTSALAGLFPGPQWWP